jgi:hypothetical protein
MRLDSLISLIEGADWMAFREIAMSCLELKGYKEVSLTDGSYDGGTDIRVCQIPPNPTRIAVQLSVQKKRWEAKLNADAHKVKSELSLNNMVFVTSHRIPESSFDSVKNEVWKETSVSVNKIDSQAIASEFYREGKALEVFQILGINLEYLRTPSSWRSNFRSAASASFSLFGNEPSQFRQTIIRSSIIAAAFTFEEGIDREFLVNEVAEIVQMPDNGDRAISSEIDRMLQRQELKKEEGALHLSDELAETHEAEQAIFASEHQQLREAVFTELEKVGRRVPTDEELDHAVDCVGAVLLEAAKDTFEAFTSGQEVGGITEQTREKIRDLYILLDTLGVSGGKKQDRAIKEIGDIASSLPAGRRLFAGELFFLLTQIRTSQLVRALGARSGIEIILDASVAIPVICGLLFEATEATEEVATYRLYEQISEHGIPITLPYDYAEEIAAHLIYAARDYGSVIGDEPDHDLVNSKNAFVAHYTRMYISGHVDSFEEYVSAFGYSQNYKGMRFFDARDGLQPKISYMFSQYGIQTRSLYVGSDREFNRAHRLVTLALRDLQSDRPDIVQEHDARTVGYLNEHENESDYVQVLCTWDNMFKHLKQDLGSLWEAMNPAVLNDLLSVSSPDKDYGRLVSPMVVAGAVSEEASAIGADVWDRLMQIERGKLTDAKLVEEAKRFKRDFIDRHPESTSMRDIDESWEEWKTANISTSIESRDSDASNSADSEYAV